MRTLYRSLQLSILLVLSAGGVLAWLAFSDEPLVAASPPLSHEDIARAEALLRGHDPRPFSGADEVEVVLNRVDLALFGRLVSRRLAAGDARVRLLQDGLLLELTRRWPALPLRQCLNVTLRVSAADGRPRLTGLKIGEITLPAPILRPALPRLVDALWPAGEIDALIQAIDQVRVSEDDLRVRYRWDPRLVESARSSLLPAVDRSALRHYHDLIVRLQTRGIGRAGSLTTLLTPLFSAATERSRDLDPVVENRALLSVLGAWAGRRGLDRLVPGDLPRPAGFRLRLRGRTDFAQHFLVSAALASRGDSALSNAVGLFKEVVDAKRGSGFSFTDIAADRAGSRFGELAVAAPTIALRLQHRAAVGLRESDFMPHVADLPEFMDQADFIRRFARIGSPAYSAMVSQIEQRIAGLPLYRDD